MPPYDWVTAGPELIFAIPGCCCIPSGSALISIADPSTFWTAAVAAMLATGPPLAPVVIHAGRFDMPLPRPLPGSITVLATPTALTRSFGNKEKIFFAPRAADSPLLLHLFFFLPPEARDGLALYGQFPLHLPYLKPERSIALFNDIAFNR